MPDSLRPLASRIAALIVGTICSFLFVRYKLDVSEEVRSVLTDSIYGLVVFMGTYVATHFAVATKVNPDDAASPGAAKAGKQKQRLRKAMASAEDRLTRFGLTESIEEIHADVAKPAPTSGLYRPPHNED